MLNRSRSRGFVGKPIWAVWRVGNFWRHANTVNSQDAFAQEAVDLFVYTIAREMGAMTAALRGLDTLVFCAGIGENSPLIREKIGEAAVWLGIKIDAQRNWWGEEDISAPSSKVKVVVFRTDGTGGG
ncbi:hypothetical protein [Phyllobacterium sp. 22552]|uniref:hypothetical protein n=1 Tax=Phyllobacterium sp. 22552 TaxID=3453941 RepID=UPI003F8458DC